MPPMSITDPDEQALVTAWRAVHALDAQLRTSKLTHEAAIAALVAKQEERDAARASLRMLLGE